jgi:hypothetical protein
MKSGLKTNGILVMVRKKANFLITLSIDKKNETILYL